MFCSRQLKADILSKILSALYDLNATYCIQTFANIFEEKMQVKHFKHLEDKLPITNTCACVGSHLGLIWHDLMSFKLIKPLLHGFDPYITFYKHIIRTYNNS